MRTFQIQVDVPKDRKVELRLPQDVSIGQHQLVIVVDTKEASLEKGKEPFPVIHVKAWPSSLSLRREDLYDETGR